MFNFSRWALLFSDWKIFAQGFGITVAISAVSLFFTLFISFVVGIARCTQSGKVKGVCNAYVSFFQNTPLLVQFSPTWNCSESVCMRLSRSVALHGSIWRKCY